MSYSPDSTRLLVASKNHSITFYDALTYSFLYRHSGAGEALTGKWSKDSKYIAAGYLSSPTLHILNGTTYTSITNISTSLMSIYEVDFSWDSLHLLVCGEKAAYMYNVSTWAVMWSNAYDQIIYSCRFASNGDFAIGDYTGKITSYKKVTTNYSQRFSSQASDKNILEMDYSPDGQTLLAVDFAGTVHHYKPNLTNSTRTSHFLGKDAFTIAYSYDGTLYATGDTLTKTKFWNGTAAIGTLTNTWS